MAITAYAQYCYQSLVLDSPILDSVAVGQLGTFLLPESRSMTWAWLFDATRRLGASAGCPETRHLSVRVEHVGASVLQATGFVSAIGRVLA